MSFGTAQRPRPTTPATADFLYDITADKLLLIIDQDKGSKSVTNDIENVLTDIIREEELGSLAGYAVAYRDSEGDWCRVLLDEAGQYEQICGFGVRVTCEAEAMRRLRELA